MGKARFWGIIDSHHLQICLYYWFYYFTLSRRINSLFVYLISWLRLGTKFPRIPFPIWFQVRSGQKKNLYEIWRVTEIEATMLRRSLLSDWVTVGAEMPGESHIFLSSLLDMSCLSCHLLVLLTAGSPWPPTRRLAEDPGVMATERQLFPQRWRLKRSLHQYSFHSATLASSCACFLEFLYHLQFVHSH